MDELTAQLQPLEESHLLIAVRSDRERLAALLHDTFTEIGSSGRTYTRADILDALPNESAAKRTLEGFQARQLASNIALTTYTTCRTDPTTKQTHRARRSSIWKHESGQWQLIFHQGTPIE
jgi:hypothetical protein